MTFDIPCGSPPHHTNVMFWGFLLTVFIVNFLVVYFVVPVWNWFCRPFTHGVRRFSECGLNYEPFMCLDDGLPCFRPHPAGWEGSVAANEKAIAVRHSQFFIGVFVGTVVFQFSGFSFFFFRSFSGFYGVALYILHFAGVLQQEGHFSSRGAISAIL